MESRPLKAGAETPRLRTEGRNRTVTRYVTGFMPLAVLSVLLVAAFIMMNAAAQNAALFGRLSSVLLLVNVLGVVLLIALILSIDSVDLRILELLNERAGLVIEVGKVKAKEQKEFYVPDREREVLKRLTDSNKGPFPNQALKNVFREIMSDSLSLEKPLKLAFLGPAATFTHQACMQHFGLSGDFVAKKDIADVFDDVEKGRADSG